MMSFPVFVCFGIFLRPSRPCVRETEAELRGGEQGSALSQPLAFAAAAGFPLAAGAWAFLLLSAGREARQVEQLRKTLEA